jgi:hypothetical protein
MRSAGCWSRSTSFRWLSAASAKSISSKEFPLHLRRGLLGQRLAVRVFTFILARVFAEGTLMREDLEGTV